MIQINFDSKRQSVARLLTTISGITWGTGTWEFQELVVKKWEHGATYLTSQHNQVYG